MSRIKRMVLEEVLFDGELKENLIIKNVRQNYNSIKVFIYDMATGNTAFSLEIPILPDGFQFTKNGIGFVLFRPELGDELSIGKNANYYAVVKGVKY